MKRKLVTILSALTLLLVATAAPVSAATSPTCGSLPEFRAYDNDHESGLLGILCPQFTTVGFDDNYGDTIDAFRNGDNDSQNSFRFYNPTSNVWCVWFNKDANFNGPSLFYELGHSDTYWVPSGGTMPSGWNNQISSVQVYKRVNGAC